jgi:hypothetical protein
VAALTPSTRKKIALRTPPTSAIPIGSNSRRAARSQSCHVAPATTARSALSPTPKITPSAIASFVERSETSFVHSDLSVAAKWVRR